MTGFLPVSRNGFASTLDVVGATWLFPSAATIGFVFSATLTVPSATVIAYGRSLIGSLILFF